MYAFMSSDWVHARRDFRYSKENVTQINNAAFVVPYLAAELRAHDKPYLYALPK